MPDLFPVERKSISDQLADLMQGKIVWDDAAPSIRSWAALPVHKHALEIMRMPTTEKRRTALDKIPGTIRPQVETEIKRLWPIRDRI